MFSQIITYTALIFLVLGGADYITGGRLDLGQEFERGIMSAGRLLICMSGFMVLAPAIAKGIAPVISPLFRAIGADPSLFAGMILASDSGGAALALELADSERAGLFNGQIVGATLGATMMFNIPMVLQSVSREARPPAIYGLLFGIITIPVGCLTAGVAGGFSLETTMGNTVPVLALSLALAAVLIFAQDKVIPLFQLWGKIVQLISTTGIVLGTIQLLSGLQLVPGMAGLEESFQVIGGICVFLAGMFPMVSVIQRLFQRQFQVIGRLLHIGQVSVGGLVSALVNGLPVLAAMEQMDGRGRMLNAAFLVSASCALGDHLAYANQIAPELAGTLVAGKLAAGVAAVLTALLVSPRLSIK